MLRLIMTFIFLLHCLHPYLLLHNYYDIMSLIAIKCWYSIKNCIEPYTIWKYEVILRIDPEWTSLTTVVYLWLTTLVFCDIKRTILPWQICSGNTEFNIQIFFLLWGSAKLRHKVYHEEILWGNMKKIRSHWMLWTVNLYCRYLYNYCSFYWSCMIWTFSPHPALILLGIPKEQKH